MERIGKFVVREYGNSIEVLRVVGYDFDAKNCVLRPFRSQKHRAFEESVNFCDYRALQKTDELYSINEVAAILKQHVERHQNVVDILASLESELTPKWLEISRRANYKEEFKHLYPALQNITITLHYLRGRENTVLYREYKKAFKNIRKRFYFYFGEPGKTAVDNFIDVAGVSTDSISIRRSTLAFELVSKRRLLQAVEEYAQECSPIEHP